MWWWTRMSETSCKVLLATAVPGITPSAFDEVDAAIANDEAATKSLNEGRARLIALARESPEKLNRFALDIAVQRLREPTPPTADKTGSAEKRLCGPNTPTW